MAAQEQYYVCLHSEHSGVMEIFTKEEFRKARRIDNRYRVLLVAASRSAALDFVQEAVGEALQRDPSLEHLKQDIQEIYL